MLNQLLKGYYFKYGSFKDVLSCKAITDNFTEDKIKERLKDETSILGTTIANIKNINKINYSIPYSDLVNILSIYLIQSQVNFVLDNGTTISLTDYLAQVGLKPTKSECLNCLNNSLFLSNLKTILPKFTRKDGIPACITMGKLIHPYKLLEKDKTNILFNSLYNCIFDITKIPLNIRLEALNLMGCPPYLLDKSNKYFQFLIQSASSLSLTPVEFLQACNIPYVDILKNVENLGHNVVYSTPTSVALHHPKTSQVLLLDNSQYKDLYEKGYLDSLQFEDGTVPFILTPNKKYLRDYFGSGAYNNIDFRKEI